MPSPVGKGRVKIYFKKEIRLDNLSFNQLQMFKLGTVGLGNRKDEILRGLNGQGQTAKPLTKGYAIFKSKATKYAGGGRNVRDLRLTGDMLREWSVRTVSDKQAFSGWSTRKGREKARANNLIEPFIVWSPRNRTAVVSGAFQMMAENTKKLIVEKPNAR